MSTRAPALRAGAHTGGTGVRCRFGWGQGIGMVLQFAPALAVFISPWP